MNQPTFIDSSPERRDAWLDRYLDDADAAQGPQPRAISLAMIRGIAFRQRWLIGGCIALAVLAGIVMTLLTTPLYQASSTVRIEPLGRYVVEGQNVDQGVASNQIYELLRTQIEVIRSRNLASRVAQSLSDADLEGLLGLQAGQSRPAGATDVQWRATMEDMAASILHGSVSATQREGTFILEIAYRSPDPVVAAKMANAYSAAFAATDFADSLADNEYAQTFLRDQIALVRQRLQDAEQAANGYSRANGIITQASTAGTDGDSGPAPTLTTINLASINERVAQARADRIAAEQRWLSVRNLPASQLPEVQSNSVLQGLISNRSAKQTELTELRERYDDDFPQVATVRSQIAELDGQIGRTAADIKSVVRNTFTVARNQEVALERELAAITGETLSEQDRQVQYSVLEREAQALRDQLGALLSRYNEVSTAADVRNGMINPLDAATVPGAPYSPDLMRNLLLALVFGIALAVGLAILREVLDDKVRSPDDIEARIGLPLLGQTPFVDAKDIAEQRSNRFSPLMEAYSSIRSIVDFSMPRDRNVIQLTSSQAGEGKTTTALVLAGQFAELGRKTLLIDGDLRRPALARTLGIERPGTGIVEVLLGEAELRSALIAHAPNLDILPVGKVPANPTEIFASEHLRDFIAEVRKHYAVVIFDSSPVLGLADGPMLSRLVDGTIFVMEANTVRFGQVRTAINRIRGSGGRAVGAILTKYRALEAGEAHDYQYAYYQYERTADAT